MRVDDSPFMPACTKLRTMRRCSRTKTRSTGSVARVAPASVWTGLNVWAWSGEDSVGFIGDPPHEPRGWYGICASDTDTLVVLHRHAVALGVPHTQVFTPHRRLQLEPARSNKPGETTAARGCAPTPRSLRPRGDSSRPRLRV